MRQKGKLETFKAWNDLIYHFWLCRWRKEILSRRWMGICETREIIPSQQLQGSRYHSPTTTWSLLTEFCRAWMSWKWIRCQSQRGPHRYLNFRLVKLDAENQLIQPLPIYYFNIYLFGCIILVVAHVDFDLHCGMQDHFVAACQLLDVDGISDQDWTRIPALGVQSLSSLKHQGSLQTVPIFDLENCEIIRSVVLSFC